MKIVPFYPARERALATALGHSHLFSGLTQLDLACIATICQTHHLKKGECLVREGEPALNFFIVESGEVTLQRTAPNGRKKIFRVVKERESFAESVLGISRKYLTDVCALTSAKVIAVPKAPFLEIIERNQELTTRILTLICANLTSLTQQTYDNKSRLIENRLASWLLQQPTEKMHVAARTGKSAVLRHPAEKLTQILDGKILASLFDESPKSISRALALLDREGAIKIGKTETRILDRAKLQQFAEERIPPSPSQQNSRKPRRPR